MDKYSVFLKFSEKVDMDKAIEVFKKYEPIITKEALEIVFKTREAALSFIQMYAADGYTMAFEKNAE